MSSLTPESDAQTPLRPPPGGVRALRDRSGGDLVPGGDDRPVWRSKGWDELPPTRKVLVMLLVAVQVSLAVSAWTDLAQRRPQEINGSKRRWAAIIAVNFLGPILYYRRGRRRP